MQLTEAAVPIFTTLIVFGFLAAVILVPRALRSMERLELMKSARQAMERGVALPPELIEAIKPEQQPPSAERDLRRGAVLIAVALALVVFSMVLSLPDFDVVGPLLGFAAFPGLIGLVYLAFWFAGRNKPAA
jgi:hypothetical protein